jgi:hypothetical protein
MKKFITPRGGGRTYQICKYAIENDCDIIVPALSSIQHIVTIIMQICYDSNGEYEYIGYNDSLHDIKVKTWNDTIVIHIIDATNFQHAMFGPARRRPVVIDDIDECMKRIINSNLIARGTLLGFDILQLSLGDFLFLLICCTSRILFYNSLALRIILSL